MRRTHQPPPSDAHHPHTPLRIGLTGGIGSGKSTVAKMFASLNVPVIDADEISHRLTRPGEPATAQILDMFGHEFADHGVLDRRRLAQHVFAHPADRERLEAFLHPRIGAVMEQEADRLDAPYCLMIIPLLIEAGLANMVDRVLVVDIDENAQAQRAGARDRRDPEEVRQIVGAQTTRDRRRAAADDIISNDGTLDALRSQVQRLHAEYLRLAAHRSP
jgi:dephospho-CoA kinase